MSSGVQVPSCTVSVIIPTRNRPEKVRACLHALTAQTFSREQFEILVVDDGSEPSVRPVIESFAGRLPVKLIEQPNSGPARARNNGADQAAGTLLAFTDDDCEPTPDWIAVLYARHLKAPERALGGRTVNSVEGNVYSIASQLLVDYLYEYHAFQAGRTRAANRSGKSEAPAFFTSNNLAVAKPIFEKVGGFGGSFALAAGEDREFCDRWQQYGYGLEYVPDAVVQHGHVLTLAGFWRQHRNYGHGASDLRKAREARGVARMRVEPLSFYWNLVMYPLVRPGQTRRLTLVGLMLLSQVANVLGFARARLRR